MKIEEVIKNIRKGKIVKRFSKILKYNTKQEMFYYWERDDFELENAIIIKGHWRVPYDDSKFALYEIIDDNWEVITKKEFEKLIKEDKKERDRKIKEYEKFLRKRYHIKSDYEFKKFLIDNPYYIKEK